MATPATTHCNEGGYYLLFIICCGFWHSLLFL